MLNEKSQSQSDTLEKMNTVVMENKLVVARSQGWRSDNKGIAYRRVWGDRTLLYPNCGGYMNHACVEIHRTVQQKYNQFCVIFFFFCKSNISCVLEFPFPIPRALPLTSCNIGSFRQYSIKLYFQPSFAFKKKKIQKTKEKSFL